MDFRLEIEKIYIAYFNRPADSGGMAYWLAEINGDAAKLQNITAAFSTTPEYRALYAGKSPEDIVTAIYANLFDREPDAGGLEYWTGVLKSGEQTVADLAYRTLDSAQSSDKAIIDNKADAALHFTEELHDTGGDTHYSGAAIDAARAWLARIDASPQSRDAAIAEIDAVVQGFDPDRPQPEPDPEPTGPARVFTFTIGWDPETTPRPVGPYDSIEKIYPPEKIDTFFLGHDRIDIVDISGNTHSVSGPTWNYLHGQHTGSPGLEYQFSIYGGLGSAHNGGKVHGLAALMAGETVLITFEDGGGQTRTLLFIDDGLNPGTGQGMDNGPGVATWYLDSDLVIEITNLVGLKTTADDLQVAGSFFG